jgi:hypothetical protein
VPTFAELNASTTPDGPSNPVTDGPAPHDSDRRMQAMADRILRLEEEVKALKECHESLRQHTMRETADRHTSPTLAPPADVPQDDPMEDMDPTAIAGPVPAHAGHPVGVPPIPMPVAQSPSATIPPPTPSPGLVSHGSASVADTPGPLSPVPVSQVAGESSGDVQMSEDPSGAIPLTPAPESAVLTLSPNTVISLLRQAPLQVVMVSYSFGWSTG